MLDQVRAGFPPFPPHLHRHLLQRWLVRHRRAPRDEGERRRAVYEYLAHARNDESGTARVLVTPELERWLHAEDERVRGFGRVSRLMALVHGHNGDLRKRYDLALERDYKLFTCLVALGLPGLLRWPESLVDPAMREVLWETAPGIRSRCRVGVTRALDFVRRNAPAVRGLDLSRPDDFSQLLLRVLADVANGRLPSYVLSPAQLATLAGPVPLPRTPLRMTGLVHHLVVERGLVAEGDLARPDVVQAVSRQVPALLARLQLPDPLRAAHGMSVATVAAIGDAPGAARHDPVVTVVGPVSHGSGLGAAARACVEAFRDAKLPVEVLNMTAGWGRTDEQAPADACTRVRGDINVIHFNPDVIVDNLSRFGWEPFEGRYNIGYFVWETSRPSLAHRLGVDLVDEVWVPTEYCRGIFASITDKPVVVVRTPVPRIGDVSWATRRYFGLAGDRFTFVYTFDGASRLTRKNPLAAVRAFQAAFPSDPGVQLVLKTQNTEHLPPPDEREYAEIRRLARADRRVVVIDESFSSNEVHGLLSVCDCYVALHRSEGFGYGMAEAMKLRVPVIATADSGNADFTTEATAWTVRSRRVPVTARAFVYDEPGQEWAEPDVAHAAERMLEVVRGTDRDRRVRAAREWVESRYSESAVGRTYRERIEAIRAGFAAGAGAAIVGARA